MEKRKTALVTGGSGYLGSHLSKTLKRDGWNVVNFDIARPNHEYCDLYVDGDIRDQYEIKRLFDRINVDTVFHLAGRIEVGDSKLHPTEFWHVNVGGTVNLLNAMTYWGVKNIIFSSSAGVYYNSEIPLTENDIISYNNPYASTKIVCETAIQDSGLNYIIFRYFNLSGADPEGELGECHLPETHLIPRIFQNLNMIMIRLTAHALETTFTFLMWLTHICMVHII
jgi:UDP-glucose 4-epimerase